MDWHIDLAKAAEIVRNIWNTVLFLAPTRTSRSSPSARSPAASCCWGWAIIAAGMISRWVAAKLLHAIWPEQERRRAAAVA